MPVYKSDPALPVEFFRERFHYDPDTGLITSKIKSPVTDIGHVYKVRGDRGHIRIGVIDPAVGRRRQLYAHRIAWMLTHGEWPKGYLDHINGDPADNRISNLRVVAFKHNCWNRGENKNGVAGLKGVHFETTGRGRKRWRAHICVDRRKLNLGRYMTAEEALVARKAAEQKYYGQYARA